MTAADTHDTAHAPSETDKSENAIAARVLFTVLILVVAWGLSIFTWGIPGLYMPAVIFTPLMYILLVTIAKG